MRIPQTGEIAVHTGELFLMWQALGLGELPTALGIAHIGRTPRARALLTEQASAALAQRDLGTVTEPAGLLADLLRTLAGAEMTVYLRTAAVRGIGACGPPGTAVATVAGDIVRIRPIQPTAMARALLDLVPDLPSGRGRQANVRVEDFEQARAAGKREGADGFLAACAAAGIRSGEARTLVSTIQDSAGHGALGVMARHRGQPLASPGTVHWVDTENGRFALRRNGKWLTVTPASRDRLLAVAEETIQAGTPPDRKQSTVAR